MKLKVGDVIIDGFGDFGKVVEVSEHKSKVAWITINGIPNVSGSVGILPFNDMESAEGSYLYEGFRLATKLERALK